MSYVGRFAPSPTGTLHLGTLVAALGSWLRARQQGGRWLVRVDDIDSDRERPGSARQILEALGHSGLQADVAPVYQSSRQAAYARALQQLREQSLAFPCWCSRMDLFEADTLHRDGRCVRDEAADRSPAWRLRVPAGTVEFDDLIAGHASQDVRQDVGDFVLLRGDGCWNYHLACAVDEAHMDITEVVRGHDLLDSTPRQILLMRLLGLPIPRYAHLPLALNNEGRKLSKSVDAPQLDMDSPVAALNVALTVLGQPAELVSGQALDRQLHVAAERFDVTRIPKSPVTHPATGA